ncbi:hypothetical protein IFM89_033625 [Coptis chinensis]|uniref:Uncharacterized protein n=1 Tax=Coptis chinensis TaxID=261450 RepID=A0A835M0A4_9MAGN|nr:hypothetical protein IFM89_033625 [Coptis chinensis]
MVMKTALIDMYVKCRCINNAYRIFKDEIPVKDEVTWTLMLSGFSDADINTTVVEFGSNKADASFDSPTAIGDLAIFKAKEVGVMDSCAADKWKGCRVTPVPPNRMKDLLY